MTGARRRRKDALEGVLNVRKPGGMTSRQVVNEIQRRIKVRRIGHAGTLDPLATGVLLLCLGRTTRLVEYLHMLTKTYRATFQLGASSDTDDVEGQVEPLCRPPIPSFEQVTSAARQFVGTIEQTPPAYSAIRVDGKRAHARARRGEHVELDPREVTIESITVDRYDYPELDMTITCHSGTYIRAIGRDLAHSLGTAAVMSRLERTRIGPFRVEDAVELDLPPEAIQRAVMPPVAAVSQFPQRVLTADEIERVLQGQSVDDISTAATSELAVGVDQYHQLIAILERAGTRWQPRKVFAQ